MLTPQDVASYTFPKAKFGGYNMAKVDEFLDVLTKDYTSLYNDFAALKDRVKTLSDSLEEYQATDATMRKTLVTAQQMADSIIADAEKKKTAMLREVETKAGERAVQLQVQLEVEERKLRDVKEAVADYVENAKATCMEAIFYLEKLNGSPFAVQPMEHENQED